MDYKAIGCLTIIGIALTIVFSTPIYALIYELKGLPYFDPARCRIIENLPDQNFRVLVPPLQDRKVPFNITEHIEKKGLREFLTRQDRNDSCFWMRFCGRLGSNCHNRVQFDSAKKERNMGTLVLISTFIAINGVVCIVFPLCFCLVQVCKTCIFFQNASTHG